MKLHFITYCLFFVFMCMSSMVRAERLADREFCHQNLCPQGDECNTSTRSQCYERYLMPNGHVNTGLKCCLGQKNSSIAARRMQKEQQDFMSAIRTQTWNTCQSALRDVIFTSIEKNRICYLYQNHCSGRANINQTLINSCMSCMPNSPNTLGQVPEKCFEPYLAGAVSKVDGEDLARNPNDFREVFLPACCQRAP